MPKYSSTRLLQQLQEQTELFLDTAIRQWQLIPHSTFARRPAAGSWSANECLQHLNSYGRYYLPAIENAMRQTNEKTANPVFQPGWLGDYFTKLMQPGSDGAIKKMKSPKDHEPPTIVDSHLVIAEFIDQQEKMLQLLRMAAEKDLNKVRVPISISKWIKLKLGDTFNFLTAHEYRHFLQAQKALGISISTTELRNQKGNSAMLP